jgi:hypothetical protein
MVSGNRTHRHQWHVSTTFGRNVTVPFIAAIVAVAARVASHAATGTGKSPAFAHEFVP